MYIQRKYEREAVSLSLDDTYRLDLPENGQLSAILLKIYGDQYTNWGLTGGNYRLVDIIDQIEIILNGATICKSLKGDMIQALSFYDQGVIAPDIIRNYATNQQIGYLLINFGRKLFDKEYGLDLSKFDNVELRIKNSATSTVEFTTLYASIIEFFLREAPAFLGYIRSEEWRKWTTVADEWKYFDLPTEHIIRRILLQAMPAVTNGIENDTPADLMDDVELKLETGVLEVFKGGVDDLIAENYLENGKYAIIGNQIYGDAGYGWKNGLGYHQGGAWGYGNKGGVVASAIPTLNAPHHAQTIEIESTRGGDDVLCVLASGGMYHNTVIFPFDKDPDPATWLDAVARKTVQLNIHTINASTAASGTNKVILDRLVRY